MREMADTKEGLYVDNSWTGEGHTFGRTRIWSKTPVFPHDDTGWKVAMTFYLRMGEQGTFLSFQGRPILFSWSKADAGRMKGWANLASGVVADARNVTNPMTAAEWLLRLTLGEGPETESPAPLDIPSNAHELYVCNLGKHLTDDAGLEHEESFISCAECLAKKSHDQF